MKRRAIFVDRDGVVNESPGEGYVLSPGDFHFRQGIKEALQIAVQRGFLLFLITNQRCVGKGLLKLQDLNAIHEFMTTELWEFGVRFTKIYAYTGLAVDGYGAKPRPDFVLEAQADYGIDLCESWFIGDQDKDMMTARAAGIRNTVRVLSGKSASASANFVVEPGDLPQVLRENLAARAP